MSKARYHPDTPKAEAQPERPINIQDRPVKPLTSFLTVPKNTEPVATNPNNMENAEATIGEEKSSVIFLPTRADKAYKKAAHTAKANP